MAGNVWFGKELRVGQALTLIKNVFGNREFFSPNSREFTVLIF